MAHTPALPENLEGRISALEGAIAALIKTLPNNAEISRNVCKFLDGAPTDGWSQQYEAGYNDVTDLIRKAGM